jgi:AraC-like DNA-binding protein
MTIDDLAAIASRLVPRQSGEAPQQVRPLANLTLLRHHRPTSFEATLYQPVVCLILQGRKETTLGVDTFKLGPGECLLVSHDLPVIARITRAPYLALLLDVELQTVRELYDEVAETLPPAAPESRALEVRRADAALIDALARYVALAGSPTDATVLGPLVAKEIHYRLLMAPLGGMLRSLIRHDSQASAVARAIAQIRRDFRTSIAVPELARTVGMSASAFHKHFKAVTAASPLQYQKDLRLLEARRLLRGGHATVSTAAFDVGYESPTQFSREYARKFGVSPRRDLPAPASRSGQGTEVVSRG